jgi:glycosyltransferase involved in cell wall biosynthesis
MKSVCLLVQNRYDIDIRVRRKAEALVAAGYAVDVYALRGSKSPKEYVLNGVNVYTVSLGKRRGSLTRYAFEYVAFFLWVLARLTIEMPRKRYAVIEANTLPDFLIFAGVFARLMGAKLLLDMHEITPEFYMSKYGMAENSASVRILKHVEKISFDFADHVLTINEPIRDLFASRGLPPGKCTVIMNSADEARFDIRPCAAADAAATDAGFVMMYHGTITRLYGLDIAIEAFAAAHNQMPGAEFWILGSGPETPHLKELARSRGLDSKVKLIGAVPPSEIPAWLSKCEVGVLSIRRDVFLEFASPNKLAEFIIMGKPVIISRLRAVQQYFNPEALAFVEPGDPSTIARQMVRLYHDRTLRTSMAASARQQYAPIRWEVMRERYLSVIQRMAADVSPVPKSRSESEGSPEREKLSRNYYS